MHKSVLQMEAFLTTKAEKVVMKWVVKGECPKRVSKKGNSKNRNSLDTLAILNQLKTKPFTDFGSTMFEEPEQR